MVERRLQILIISWRPDERAVSAFLSRKPSTKGPFHTERAMARPSYFFFRAWRFATMNLAVDLLRRVFLPLVGNPQGVTGWRPPDVRPSPPPCGWSMGCMVPPRLWGTRPSQRLRAALPIETFMLSGFDTAPTVAMHRPCTRRCSAELSRRMTYSPSRPTICAYAPAERATCPPWP